MLSRYISIWLNLHLVRNVVSSNIVKMTNILDTFQNIVHKLVCRVMKNGKETVVWG